jgi:hypothetical protein
MTDDQKPENLGRPPVGGPLRPDQQPPGFPDPNAPRLEFGPGSPQLQTPPTNGTAQNGQHGQHGPSQAGPTQNGQGGPSQGGPAQNGTPRNSSSSGSPSYPNGRPNGAPGQQPTGSPQTNQGQQAAPDAGGRPWPQQGPPSGAPAGRPPAQGQQQGPDGYRPPAPYGQSGQGQQPSQPNQPHGGPQARPTGAPNGQQGNQPFGQGRPPGPQPFGPGQAQHPGAPFPAGQSQGPQQQGPSQRPGQQQPGPSTGPFRPGPEYGGPAQQSASTPKAPRKPLGRKLWTGVVIGAVAASLIAVPLTLLSVGRLFTPMLDRGAVQTGVADVLKQDFGLADVEKVECPSDQPATTGTQFECTFSYNAKSYPVAVEVINDQGQYRVGVDAPK